MSESNTMELYEFLELLAEQPELGFTSHERVLHRVFALPGSTVRLVHGEEARRYGVIEGTPVVSYAAFDIFEGREMDIRQYAKFTKAAAENVEQARQIVNFVGPTSTGKSTLELTKARFLEGAPIGMLDPKGDGTGCPHRDRVFWMIPRSQRGAVAEHLGVTIEPWADICMECRSALHNLPQLQEYPLKDPANPENERWRHFPVTIHKIGRREGEHGVGYAVLRPFGQFTADLQKIIGEEDLTEIDKYPRGHLNTLLFNGVMSLANQGTCEFREVYKIFEFEEIADMITFATQEKLLDGPAKYGEVSVDVHLTGHSNKPDYDNFHERGRASVQIASREKVIFWRHMLSYTWESGIYRKELAKSDFIGSDGHFAPDVLELAAMFVIATRIDPKQHTMAMPNLILAYDGRRESTNRTVLLEESPEDGMFGRDARTSTKALGSAYAADEFDVSSKGVVVHGLPDHARCVIWPEVRAEIREDLHPARYDAAETRQEYLGYLTLVDKFYHKLLQRRVVPVLYAAFADDAKRFFAEYVTRAKKWVREEADHDATADVETAFAALVNLLVHDEQIMGISPHEAEGFRQGVSRLAQEALREGRELDWRGDPAVAERIETFLRFMISSSALPADLAERLTAGDFCDRCAQKTAAYVADHKGEILTI